MRRLRPRRWNTSAPTPASPARSPSPLPTLPASTRTKSPRGEGDFLSVPLLVLKQCRRVGRVFESHHSCAIGIGGTHSVRPTLHNSVLHLPPARLIGLIALRLRRAAVEVLDDDVQG